MRVVVLHNAVSDEATPDEADVLIQVEAVSAALAGVGCEVAVRGCDLELRELAADLAAEPPDLVFNLVESLAGSGRLISLVPAVIETLRLPLAGCPADAIYLTSHKTLAKRLLRSAGLPTPDWLEPDGRTGADTQQAASAAPQTWIVKSVWEDASVGLDDAAVVTGDVDAAGTTVRHRSQTPGAPWFAETYIEGREFNIALLDGPAEPEVLPPAEMLFPDYPVGKPRIVGYAAKWHPESFEYEHTVRTFEPAAGDGSLRAELTRLSRACWDLFGLHGWARVDFRVDSLGRPWILEVNVNPCLAPDAGFAAALEQAGIPFDAAIHRILHAATEPARACSGTTSPAPATERPPGHHAGTAPGFWDTTRGSSSGA